MPYVELHSHSAFSFLDGASSPEELATRAAELGYPALALTDHDGLWGAMEFALACDAVGVKPVTGAELTVMVGSEAFHLTLLAATSTGYSNLCQLLTEAHSADSAETSRDRAKSPALQLESLEAYAEGLICLSGCAAHGVLSRPWEAGGTGLGRNLLSRLLDCFGKDRLFIELQRPYWRHDRARNRWLAGIAAEAGLGAVATGNAHCHIPSRAFLQDALVSLGAGLDLASSGHLRRGNHSSVLAPPEVMAERFREHPRALAEATEIATMVEFDLGQDLGYRYPKSDDPNAHVALNTLCRQRFDERYLGRQSADEARSRLEQELAIIRELGLSGFFLLHHELLELARIAAREVRGESSARSLLPPGRGRGSSVSSIVCFLTGLSHVDPVEAGLFPGRFLSEELDAVPDIDLDFPRDIRARLIPMIHEHYGTRHSALVASFPTFRLRGGVREFGKVVGLPTAEIEKVARWAEPHMHVATLSTELEEIIGRERASASDWRCVLHLCEQAMGLPRHPSQHAGGMIVSSRPLVEMCPVVPAAMEGRQTVQWDKDSCQDAGFLKIDLLGLGMLSAVERCVDEIARVRGERIDLSRVDLEDSATFAAIQRAETTGVFQIESRAQMQILPRVKPANIEDLAVQIALIRPGPIQGGAVHPYIENRTRRLSDPDFEPDYLHPLLRSSLGETLGVIIFQEQVLQVAMDVAGFSPSEAEGLRRAMSRKRSRKALASYAGRFTEGAAARGVSAELADSIFDQIIAFSGFGFPKAHSAAFAVLAFQSAWLKVHYGPEYLVALLNEQPMGFYSPDSLVQEARRSGIEVVMPDVNWSHVESSAHLEPDRQSGEPVVRLGLSSIRSIGNDLAERIVVEREAGGLYTDLEDLNSRLGLERSALEALAWAGALAGPAGKGRRQSLWRAGVLGQRTEEERSGQLQLALPLPDEPGLPAESAWSRLRAEYETIGIASSGHPANLVRPSLGPDVSTTALARQSVDGAQVSLCGLVTARQKPPTAKGTTFLLLEDETGALNLVVPPPVAERYRAEIRTAILLLATGRLERRGPVANLVVTALKRLQPEREDPNTAPLEAARRRTGYG